MDKVVRQIYLKMLSPIIAVGFPRAHKYRLEDASLLLECLIDTDKIFPVIYWIKWKS